MVFDMTVNLGHIITLLGILITFITWGQGIKWSIQNLDKRVEALEGNMHEQTKLIIANAVMNQNIMTVTDRLATLERRMQTIELKKQANFRT